MKYKQLKIDYKTPFEKQLEELGIENYLDLEKIEDLFPHQDIIYDIEDGEEMKNKSPNQAEGEFKKQGRRGLNVYEGLALFRKNPKVLENHFIDLIGSRCRSGGAPGLGLGGGRPRLGWSDLDGAGERWGAASCGSRSSEVENLDFLEDRILKLEEFRTKVEKVLKI